MVNVGAITFRVIILMVTYVNFRNAIYRVTRIVYRIEPASRSILVRIVSQRQNEFGAPAFYFANGIIRVGVASPITHSVNIEISQGVSWHKSYYYKDKNQYRDKNGCVKSQSSVA